MFLLYLDPGSGSFLIQLLIAGIAAIGVAIASQWAKVRRFLRKKKKPSSVEDEDED